MEPEGDIVEDAHMRKQGIVLEHHADLALVHRGMADVAAVEADLARIGLDEAGDGAQQRGLAAPAGAQQAEELAIGEGERDAGQGGDGTVMLLDSVDLDDAHLSPPKRYSRAKISINPMETRMMMVEMALISGVKPLRIDE